MFLFIYVCVSSWCCVAYVPTDYLSPVTIIAFHLITIFAFVCTKHTHQTSTAYGIPSTVCNQGGILHLLRGNLPIILFLREEARSSGEMHRNDDGSE